MNPDYLIIGNITKDITLAGGDELGGTSSYAALCAHKLGRNTALVAGIGEDAPSLASLVGVEISCIRHKFTDKFENVYENNTRRQKWRNQGARINADDISQAWRSAAIVHFAPIGQEFSPTLSTLFPNSVRCATVQGWLRGRGNDDDVIFKMHPQLMAELPHFDIVVASLSDFFGDEILMRQTLSMVKIGIETLGADGCRIYQNGEVTHVPTIAQPEVDPTGAGDVFAAAFFIRFEQTDDPILAAKFANACASLSVGGRGTTAIPNIPTVLTQMRQIYGDSFTHST